MNDLLADLKNALEKAAVMRGFNLVSYPNGITVLDKDGKAVFVQVSVVGCFLKTGIPSDVPKVSPPAPAAPDRFFVPRGGRLVEVPEEDTPSRGCPMSPSC